MVPMTPVTREGLLDLAGRAEDRAERAWELAEHEGSGNPAYDGATDEAVSHEALARRLVRIAEPPPPLDHPDGKPDRDRRALERVSWARGERYADQVLDQEAPDDLDAQHRAWLRVALAEAFLDGMQAAAITDDDR